MGLPTIHDVADHAGVSIATVSRALTGRRRVDPEIVARVTAAAEELGYRPNALARGLRRQSTGTIGMVVPGIANPFFAAVVEEIEKVLQESGLDLLLCNSMGDIELEANRLQILINRRVDGLLVIACDAKRSGPALREASSKVSVVQLDRLVHGIEADYIGVDDESGISQALAHLAQQGARKVQFVSATTVSSTARRRLLSFRTGAERLGLDTLDPELQAFTADWGIRAAQKILASGSLPDAIVCGDDAIAFGVLQGLAAAAIPVPNAVMVTGFDGVPFSAVSNPPLTTVEQPIREIASIAVRMLDERTHKEFVREPREVLVEPKLIIRASTDATVSRDSGLKDASGSTLGSTETAHGASLA